MKKVWLAIILSMMIGSIWAGTIAWRTPKYTLVARQMPVREALDAFAIAEGLSVVMSDGVQGVFSGDFQDVEAGEFLDRLATIHNLTWYHDGAAIYVYTAGEILTNLTDLRYMKAEDVVGLLKELGVEDERFPIKTAMNGEIIMVSGPPRYVQLVTETIARADRLKEMRTFNEIETRIFPLHNSWADSVSLNVAGPESTMQIRGVADLLQEMMAQNGGNSREADTNRVDSAEQRLQDAALQGVKPVIRAENRLNAVVVRDAAPRMAMYERLIKELDVPQKLVEIAVTTVELSKDDALDWQMSLKVTGSHRDFGGSAGQNVSNLMAPESIMGGGLASAITYVGDNISISGSLMALKEKGKARNISRTAILTMNNMAAELTDTQSYHARVVGTEVANLAEVSAGTRLAIKPRIAPKGSEDEKAQIWMTMLLQDGGFETVTVDAMPLSRNSSLETQAAVHEGESIMLAGYMRDIKEEAGWGIPYLRDIPFLGWLFGGSSTKNETVQRFFILTPYVIELGKDNIVGVQASRHRDIKAEDSLSRNLEFDDDARAERELLQNERDEIKHEQNRDKLEKETKEIEFRREQRADERKKAKKAHQEDLNERREEWLKEKDAK